MKETGGEGDDKKEKSGKSRLWVFDPSVFRTKSPPASIWSRILSRLKTIGFYSFGGVLFGYPLFLVYMGLVYGWLGFWGTFVGSMTLIGFVIHRSGYGRNFESFGNESFKRRVAGLTLGFLVAAGLYEGLFVLKQWLFPLILIVLIGGLSLKIFRD